MTTFEPIVGSGFDAIAGQRQFWGQFNKSTEEANLARAKAAQDEINAHAMALSGAERSDAANAYQMQQDRAARAMAAMQLQDQNQRHNYEFGVNTGLAHEQIAASALTHRASQIERDSTEKKQLDSIQKTAEFMAPDVANLGSKYEDAQKQYDDAHQTLTTLPSELVKTLPPGKFTYNPRLNEFVSINPRMPVTNPEDVAAQNAVNDKLAAAKAEFDAAASTFRVHSDNFGNAQAIAQKSGLLVGKRDGKWVISSPNHGGKVFGLPETQGPPLPPAAAPASASQNPFDPVGNVGSIPASTGGDVFVPPSVNPIPAANPFQSSPSPDAPAILPLPTSKDEVVKGQVYQTKNHGPAIWNGKKLILIGSDSPLQ